MTGTVHPFTIRAVNHGPAIAHDVVVTAAAPATTSVESVDVFPSDASCDVAGRTVTCELASLADEGTITQQPVFQISVAVRILTTDTPIQIPVSVTSATPEVQPDPTPNSVTGVFDVVPGPGQISGVVRRPNGTPVAGVIVRAYRPSDGLLSPFFTTTAPDGGYGSPTFPPTSTSCASSHPSTPDWRRVGSMMLLTAPRQPRLCSRGCPRALLSMSSCPTCSRQRGVGHGDQVALLRHGRLRRVGLSVDRPVPAEPTSWPSPRSACPAARLPSRRSPVGTYKFGSLPPAGTGLPVRWAGGVTRSDASAYQVLGDGAPVTIAPTHLGPAATSLAGTVTDEAGVGQGGVAVSMYPWGRADGRAGTTTRLMAATSSRVCPSARTRCSRSSRPSALALAAPGSTAS